MTIVMPVPCTPVDPKILICYGPATMQSPEVPSYQDMMLPLLKTAADGAQHRVREIAEAVAEMLSMAEDARRAVLPDGRNKLIHRLEWARTYLRHAGLLTYPGRGLFQITGRGLSVLSEIPGRLDNKFLLRFPEFKEFLNKGDSEIQSSETVQIAAQAVDPEEALQATYEQLRNSAESELLARVKAASPDFFEMLVIDLLLALGYGGGQRESARLTGQSHDAGIDGIINEDALGLDVIYVQAKRWEGTVGRPEIHKFVGALQGQRAQKGVFITTSTFSREATDFVSGISNKVVLIDGRRLAKLMFDHDLGVSTQVVYKTKRLDSDYFSEE